MKSHKNEDSKYYNDTQNVDNKADVLSEEKAFGVDIK